MMATVLKLDSARDSHADDRLIAQIAARDEAAFRIISERYSRLLYSIAYRMLNNRSGAEDIVQDVLMKLWNFAGSWDSSRGASVKTWLCRIAGNACIDQQRRRRHESLDAIPDPADGADGAEARIESAETGRIVGLALQDLPERQRLALVMFHYEDLSMAEIAVILETTPKAAEGLLTRGRAALRQALEQYRGVL